MKNSVQLPMIIIMPDVRLSCCVGSYDGTVKYKDASFNEFIPFNENYFGKKNPCYWRFINGRLRGFTIFTKAFNFMERKIKHEFRILRGQHNWEYWQKSIEDVLKYLEPRFQ